ncbi:MAG TPA: hypothetical protein VIF60_04665 [Burkholderiaceae bacterium]
MTERISGKPGSRNLPNEAGIDLPKKVDGATELRALLDRFGAEIEKLGLVDGYLINLRDAASEYLVSQKVHLTPEFHNLEETYYRYKVALSGDALNLNARAFHGRGIVQCNATNGSEIERNLLQLWKLHEIAAIAILDDADFNKTPLGTLLLLKQDGAIGENVFVAIEHLISSYHAPLQLALQRSYLQEHNDSATLEQSRFLQFVVELNNLTSTETIYQVFATEMFRQFAFDGMGFFLLEGDMLVNKRVEAADPHYDDISAAWSDYLRLNPYALDATDGGVSHTFLKNIPLVFHDVQSIMGLPMSVKDRGSLNILQTPRTLLLIPICDQQHAVGVLAFFSLSQPVEIAEGELQTILKLASYFGKAIRNINDHLLSQG